jgi:transcriptional regulator
MSPRDTLNGALDVMILKILSRQPKLHGYALMSAMTGAGGDALRVEEGSIYPALRRLEEAGWLRGEWVLRAGRRARAYELTRAGRKHLSIVESEWRATTTAVNRVLKLA